MTRFEPYEVEKRSKAAWLLRDQWRSILQDAYDLVYPGINPYAPAKKNPRPLNKQFDSTAAIGVVRLANRILTEMTPPDQNWIEIKAGPILEMQYEKPLLEELEKETGKAARIANMVVNSGNAVDARAGAILDMIIAGLGCVLGMDNAADDVHPIIDQCVSQAEIAIDESADGTEEDLYRKRKIKVRQIREVWPDAILPEILPKVTKDTDPEIEVIEATYRNRSVRNSPWYYEVLFCAGGAEPVRLVERSYMVSPWTLFRWMKLPGIPYGPGPVLLALADIRTANKVMEMLLQNAALALAGMYMVMDDGVVNVDQLTITPGGMIPVQSTGGSMGASIAPLPTNRTFDVGQLVQEDIRNAIKKHLFDTSLPPDRATPRSATEIIQRVREFNQDMGVGVGRMQADVIQYVRRRVEILARRGFIPDMAIDQFTLKIQINAPLARAQKLGEVETVVNWYQMVLSLAGPQVAAVVGKIEEISSWSGAQMGVPSDLVRTKSEQQAIQQNIAMAMQAQASMEGQQAA